MSNITIGVASGLTGALLGGATVYILVRKKLEEDIRAEAEEEIKEVRSYYKNKDYENVVKIPEESEESKEVRSEDPRTSSDPLGMGRHYDRLITRYSGSTPNPETEEASTIFSEEDTEEESEDFTPQEGEATSDVIRRVHGDGAIIADTKEDPKAGFIEISESVWEENEWGFEKSYLRYFPEDDIVIDSSDIALPSPQMTIGALGMRLIDEQDVTHIANFEQEILLEITRDEGTYQEHIFGVRNHKDPLYQTGDKNV